MIPISKSSIIDSDAENIKDEYFYLYCMRSGNIRNTGGAPQGLGELSTPSPLFYKEVEKLNCQLM